MRFIIVLAAGLPAWSQILIDPARVADVEKRLKNGELSKLSCEVTPFKPRIDFGFRFQTGYTIRVPMQQYEGEGHGWIVYTRVTPEGGKPSYLLSVQRLPKIPKTKAELETGGSFVLGEGKYHVELMLYDDSGRACTKKWRVDAKRTSAEQKMTMRIDPGSVRSLSSRRRGQSESSLARPYRLTILMHAAPMFPRSTRLRAYDQELLLGSLAPLIEQLPVQSVRLVVFNLDQQKTLIEKDQFHQRDLNEIAQSMSNLQLATVEYQVLKNRTGHMRLLAELINKEVTAEQPSDAVILFGPMSRFYEKFTAPAVEERSVGGPKFFSVQFRPFNTRGDEYTDLLEHAVKALKGKSFVVHTPGEFSKAIQEIESRLPRS